jgi:hypothetical protein
MTDPDKKTQGEHGQLSDTARPETGAQDAPAHEQPASQAPGEDSGAGRNGRPSDDSDPGHS